jgi:hypothetical protein
LNTMNTIATGFALLTMVAGWECAWAEANGLSELMQEYVQVHREMEQIKSKVESQPHMWAELLKRQAAFDKYRTLVESVAVANDPKAQALLDEQKKLKAQLRTGSKTAEEAQRVKERIAAIDIELHSNYQRALEDPEVKDALQTMREAYRRYQTLLEEEMIRQEPKAKELLERKKELGWQIQKLKAARPKDGERP